MPGVAAQTIQCGGFNADLSGSERRCSTTYSEKFGKSFDTDPKEVRQGKRFLKWEVDKKKKAHVLRVHKIPNDLTAYKAVSFWLGFPKNSGPYQVVFKGLGKTRSDYGKMLVNGFFNLRKGHRGWKRIEIPLKLFSLQGEAKWEFIKDFRIEFTTTKKLTVYVDSISLIK